MLMYERVYSHEPEWCLLNHRWGSYVFPVCCPVQLAADLTATNGVESLLQDAL